MPGMLHHQTITRQALISAGVGNAEKLICDYCVFPDNFHRRYAEIAPYMFIMDGVEFHYPPHTPVEDFYRYWHFLPERGNRMLTLSCNNNLRHAEAGFRFYFENIIAELRAGQREEAWKFMGCLLHFLEDSTFGVHAFEGPDGTDIYALDRMSGKNVAKYICSIPLEESAADIVAIPQVFASDIAEAVPLLYRRYNDATARSRRAVFDIALDYLTGKSERSVAENQRIMFETSVQIAADTVATIMAIAEERAVQVKERDLSAFAPYHYPIGGGGGFQLEKYCENGNKISFGVNLEARLLYHLPEKFYCEFNAELTFEKISALTIDLINHGKVEKSIEIDRDCTFKCRTAEPGGEFGFIVRASAGCGKVVIKQGKFHS